MHANMEFTLTNMRIYTFYLRTILKLHIDIHKHTNTQKSKQEHHAREIYAMYACSRIPFRRFLLCMWSLCLCARAKVCMCVSQKHLFIRYADVCCLWRCWLKNTLPKAKTNLSYTVLLERQQNVDSLTAFVFVCVSQTHCTVHDLKRAQVCCA